MTTVTFAVAVPLLLEFVVDTPLIVHVAIVAGAIAAAVGAVKSPVLLMEPHVVDQVTDWFTVNCVCPMA